MKGQEGFGFGVWVGSESGAAHDRDVDAAPYIFSVWGIIRWALKRAVGIPRPAGRGEGFTRSPEIASQEAAGWDF